MNSYIRNTALLIILVIFTVFLVVWSNLVVLDEMSRVQGVIIPSSKEKVIQSEFNGRLVEIKVKLGDKLKKNDLIARVSDEEIIEDQKSKREDYLRAKASIQRIESLRFLKVPKFDTKFVREELENRSDIALEQIEIAQTSLASYNEELLLIKNQRDQRACAVRHLETHRRPAQGASHESAAEHFVERCHEVRRPRQIHHRGGFQHRRAHACADHG